MSANNTLGVEEESSDVKEDSLPTTATLLDKSKSLFGNSSDAHSAPVMDTSSVANEGNVSAASNVSDTVDSSELTSGAGATNTEETTPSDAHTEKEEPMDTSDSPNPATADNTEVAEESFEKKTISMDTSANVQDSDPTETPEEKMEEGLETTVTNGNEENGDADKTGNIPEDNEEPEANELGMENDEDKNSIDGRGTSEIDEDIAAAEDENVKTDEEFEEDDEEEEEVPKKKPKRIVVDDDDMSDEQTEDASIVDQIDSVEDDSAASEGAPEIPSHVSRDSSSEKAPTSQLGSTENDGEAPVLDDSSTPINKGESAPEEEEVIADESTKEEPAADDGDDASNAQEEAAVNEHDEPNDDSVAATEPTSSRSTRTRRTSAAAPPSASATPRRGGRGRQSQVKAENDDIPQERSTPARRGRSSRGAHVEEEQAEVVVTGDDHVEGEEDAAGEEKDEKKTETPKRSGRGRRSAATPAVATPRSMRGKGRKSHATEESAEPSVEVLDEGASNETTKRTPRQRKSTVNAEEEAHEEDVTEANGPSTSTSRRSARARAPAKSAPATPATNKRTPARGRKKEVSITEETAEEVEKSEETPVAKKGGRRKSAPASTKKADDSDPYDIDTEMEHHPEPLKNIHVQMEVQSFGAVKYGKTGDSESKYSKTERAAESRVAELQTTPEGKNKRSLADMTPGKEKQKRPTTGTGGRKPRVKKDAGQVEDVVMEEVPQPDASETPSSNRARKRKSEMSDVPTPPAKRDQTVALKMLNDEEQLLADHPEDDNCPHAPGARVYAIFQKTFYPAVILAERDGLGRYKLQFIADKVIKDVPNSGVIPLRVLTAGKMALYNEEEVRLDSTPKDISAGEWAKGKLGITILDADGNPTEETKCVLWNEVSFDQSEWRDYVKSLEQNATAIVKSNITTISEASRVRKPTITQTMKPKSRKKKSDGDVAPSRGASASPIDEDELIPMKPEAVGKNIFAGKVFMLTSASRSSASNVQPMFKKKNLMTFISQNGGEVTEHLNNFQERYPGCQPLLISDTYYRTHKYLAALARAIPCISNTWLKVCGEMGDCVDYKDFVLPAGASIFDDGEDMPAPENPSELLTGRKIYVHSTHSVREVTQTGPGGTFVEIWKPILELLGAEVVDADWQSLKGSDVTYDVALVDGTFREEVIEHAKSIGASRVTSEWVIQTIILGKAPEPDGHIKFDPYRLHHRYRH